jgi:chromosome segregation ATPase
LLPLSANMAQIQSIRTVEKNSSYGEVEETIEKSSLKRPSDKTTTQSSKTVYFGPTATNVVTDTEVRKVVTQVEDNYVTYDDDYSQYNDSGKIIAVREHERQELETLNDRLANFLDKVHALEWENRGLDAVKAQWEKNVLTIGQIYQTELNENQRTLEESGKIRAALEAQIPRMQSDLVTIRNKFDEAVRNNDGNDGRLIGLLKQLSDGEAELNFLRRRYEYLEEEVTRLRKENARLLAELEKVKNDIAQQVQKSLEYQNHVQSLRQKIVFLQNEYQQEIHGLRSKQVIDVSGDFKSELSAAMIDIRQEFAALNAKKKSEMQSWYLRKVEEVRISKTGPFLEEHKRLNFEIETLRGKMTDFETRNSLIRSEIQNLKLSLESDKARYLSILAQSEEEAIRMSNKTRTLKERLHVLFQSNQNLRTEIEVYRKLLDGEGVSKSSMVKVKEREKEEIHIIKEEQVAHTKFERSHKGNVQFYEINREGKYIILENTSFSQDEDISEFKLVRKLENRKEVSFTFPAHFILKPGQTVKIWANNQGGTHNPPESLIFDHINSWGVGQIVATSLYNRNGEERAVCYQTTVTSQRTLNVA